MFSGNTETRISVEYADNGANAGKINLVVDDMNDSGSDTTYELEGGGTDGASFGTGTGTIKVYITPKGGGSATLVKQLSITFTAATATPLLTTVALGTPSPTAIAGAGGAASTITVNLRDQNATAVASGKTVTVSTDEGVIDSNGTTCDIDGDGTKDTGSDASCTFTWTGGQATVSLWGIGNTGTATVTVKATPFGTTTPVKSTKSVTFTGGSVSTLSLGLFNSTSATSAPAAYVIKNVDDTAGADNTSDEILDHELKNSIRTQLSAVLLTHRSRGQI